MQNKRMAAVAYIPALHKGYKDFFDRIQEKGITDLYLVSDDVLGAHEELDYINRKDRLRALSQEDISKAVSSFTKLAVGLLDTKAIQTLQEQKAGIVCPNEDISVFIAEKYFAGHEVHFEDIFLRWHRDNTGEEDAVSEMETMSADLFQKNILKQIADEAQKSADWWRQIGAAIVKNGEVVVVTHNEHMPEEQLPNIIGDSRTPFKRGININYVTSAHAEVAAIGEMAKRGISTEGGELYVTDFPCPYCARLIVKSGIKKLYFLKGYAVLAGDAFLKDAGIEIVRIQE